MKRILLMSGLCFTLLIILPCQSFARIGDTLEECKARYEPFESFNVKGAYSFIKDGIVIVTFFFDGKVDKIRYVKFAEGSWEVSPFTNLSDNEIQTLLKANGGNRKWVKLKDQPLWKTEDGEFVANLDDDYTNLWILTRARLGREVAKEKEEKAK